MEPVTLFDSDFKELGKSHIFADVECGDISASNDLQITSALPDNCYGIAILGTDCGGVIEYDDLETGKNAIRRAWTWRGLLTQWVLCPPAGNDYLTISNKELNAAIRDILGGVLGGFFVVPAINTGVTITNYQFELYTDALTGLSELCKSVGHKLYIHAEKDAQIGRIVVYVEARPIRVETGTFDSNSNLTIQIIRDDMKATHMICMGKGELQNRTRVDLYLQRSGAFSETQDPYYSGFKERQYYYNNTSAETRADLKKDGLKKFEEICPYKKVVIKKCTAALDVGDIARTEVENISAKAAVRKKIYKINGDTVSIDYSVKE